MPEYLLWHFLFLSGGGFFFLYWLLYGRHNLFVRELSQRLGGKVVKTYGSIFGWKTVLLAIWLRERQILIEYRFRQIQPRSGKFIPGWHLSGELEIRFPVVQKFWLRLLQQHQDETPVDELVTGVPQLDKSYVIHANQITTAKDFLKRPVVSDRIMKFPIPLDRLEIYKGFLKGVIAQPYRQRIRREEFEKTVQLLLDLIDVYEHQQMENLQILQSEGDRSCPYCRGIFDADSDSIVKCVRCGTSLHQQCWQENGQCTTWGCTSTAAE
jgi:hypothetical protein